VLPAKVTDNVTTTQTMSLQLLYRHTTSSVYLTERIHLRKLHVAELENHFEYKLRENRPLPLLGQSLPRPRKEAVNLQVPIAVPKLV
jgi:hypothetical protein